MKTSAAINLIGRGSTSLIPSKEAAPVTVLIGADSPLMAWAIESSLSSSIIQVVGTVSTVVAMIRVVQRLRPQIAILDLGKSQPIGMQVIAELMNVASDLKIIGIVRVQDWTDSLEILNSSVRAYVLNTCSRGDLQRAVRSVHRFGSFEGSFRQPQAGEGSKIPLGSLIPNIGDSLTATELRIARLVCLGLSNKAVADSVGRSKRTIETHRAAVMRKLKCHSVVDLVRLGIAQGIANAN